MFLSPNNFFQLELHIIVLIRNLQEQVKKTFCYQKLFWTFTVWINWEKNILVIKKQVEINNYLIGLLGSKLMHWNSLNWGLSGIFQNPIWSLIKADRISSKKSLVSWPCTNHTLGFLAKNSFTSLLRASWKQKCSGNKNSFVCCAVLQLNDESLF